MAIRPLRDNHILDFLDSYTWTIPPTFPNISETSRLPVDRNSRATRAAGFVLEISEEMARRRDAVSGRGATPGRHNARVPPLLSGG